MKNQIQINRKIIQVFAYIYTNLMNIMLDILHYQKR